MSTEKPTSMEPKQEKPKPKPQPWLIVDLENPGKRFNGTRHKSHNVLLERFRSYLLNPRLL
nr:peptidyl-tRNA hydrolase, mitochondrial-like [Ipomoea batatas]